MTFYYVQLSRSPCFVEEIFFIGFPLQLLKVFKQIKLLFSAEGQLDHLSGKTVHNNNKKIIIIKCENDNETRRVNRQENVAIKSCCCREISPS